MQWIESAEYRSVICAHLGSALTCQQADLASDEVGNSASHHRFLTCEGWAVPGDVMPTAEAARVAALSCDQFDSAVLNWLVARVGPSPRLSFASERCHNRCHNLILGACVVVDLRPITFA